MKKLLIASLIALSNSSALAGNTCSALDYEEMKGMPEHELVEEYCQNLRKSDDLIVGGFMAAMDAGNNLSAAEGSSNEASKCRNEAKRIERILAKAGRTVSYKLTCQK